MIVGHILLFSYYFPGDKTRAEQGQMAHRTFERKMENIFQLRKRNFIVLNLIGNKVCLGGSPGTFSLSSYSVPSPESQASSIS